MMYSFLFFLISLTENIDTSSPNGRFFLTILSSLSQLEREITSSRVKDTLQGLKMTNKPYFNDMYGYDKIDGSLVVNETEQKMLKKIVKLHKLGYTIHEIVNYLNSKVKFNKMSLLSVNKLTFSDLVIVGSVILKVFSNSLTDCFLAASYDKPEVPIRYSTLLLSK